MFRNIKRRRRTAVLNFHSRNIRHIFFCQTDNFLEIILSLNEKHHIPRLIEPTGKGQDILRAKTPQKFRFPQNVSSQRMITEYHIFKIIEDQFGRIVFIGLDFVNNHFCFLFNLMLRKSRMEYNIPQ